MSNNLYTDTLSAPLDGATTARVDINSGSGNLTIDQLPSGEHVLASGTLEYFGKQGRPTRTVSTDGGQATVPGPLGGVQGSNRVADPPQLDGRV